MKVINTQKKKKGKWRMDDNQVGGRFWKRDFLIGRLFGLKSFPTLRVYYFTD